MSRYEDCAPYFVERGQKETRSAKDEFVLSGKRGVLLRMIFFVGLKMASFVCIIEKKLEESSGHLLKHFIFTASNHFTTLYMLVYGGGCCHILELFARRLFLSCCAFVLYF